MHETTPITTDSNAWNQLLTKGNDQGFVTYDDILTLMPTVEQNIDELEELLESLSNAGIEVVATPPTRDEEADEDEIADEGEEATLDPSALYEDLSQDAGYQQAMDTDDVVGLYLKEAGRVPLLTGEEEIALAKRMEAGRIAGEQLEEFGDALDWDTRDELYRLVNDGDAAQEYLVRANARLVISVAKKYIGRGVHFLDLIQEGNIGLIRAARKFEYQRGHKFSTYATWWIRQAVSRAVADQGRTIRVPVHMGDQINRLRRTSNRLMQDLGRDPTMDEIAAAMETTPDKVEDLIEISRRPVSLESPIEEDADSEFGDFIEDQTTPQPTEVVTANLLREHLAQALERLPEREAHILQLRYGLADGETHTLEEVGREIGVTRERVRQLEAQALNRLRHSSAYQLLQDYVQEG
ncbi:MAG TPA: sigma-70 family RNA polymerase sigma factor [Aggregatilinea sp.]|uniref:sigma-70 family RNA polymerase sigma factor n=1 Tax=Aggregatilinea sp. TaxID=2806333 RepID=UPI002C1CE1DC|nr:sigma-70 family RNA polymerase sigma factor [Aggregatilinea sp.]HML21212.1 sigma-70 family RNA polymerase sigma factor [Aggregatilinea sp.]